MNENDQRIVDFLTESNAIEGVFGTPALNQSMEAWRYTVSFEELNLEVVLKTHKRLMVGQPLQPNERGYLREIPVYVGRSAVLPPEMIKARLLHWITDMNEGFKDWKELHVEFERIHPFVDGNGRLGRIFLNWYMVKKYQMPVKVIKDSEKHQYYQWFR